MFNWLRNKLRGREIKKILGMVDVEDLLIRKPITDEKGKIHIKVMLGGAELDDGAKVSISKDAYYFENSSLWRTIDKHLKWHAYQQAFTRNDLKGGQDIILTLKLISDLIKEFKKL